MKWIYQIYQLLVNAYETYFGTTVLELVSVIIPCYKQAQYLGEAIESVFQQTYLNYEIIVVDDESPDETADVAARYPAVRYIRQERRERSAARNRGLAESRGQFVVFLDADDRLSPNHFEASLQAFRDHPAAAFVCGDYRWFGADGLTNVHDCCPAPDHYGKLLRRNFIGPPHVGMFRQGILSREGGFASWIDLCEDQELYLRISRRYPIHCHHAVVAEYRRHGQQSSHNWDRMMRSARTLMNAQKSYVKGRPVYEQAWREGADFRRKLYGEPLLWSMVSDARSNHWRKALAQFYLLLRSYPEGLLFLGWHKIIKMLRRNG